MCCHWMLVLLETRLPGSHKILANFSSRFKISMSGTAEIASKNSPDCKIELFQLRFYRNHLFSSWPSLSLPTFALVSHLVVMSQEIWILVLVQLPYLGLEQAFSHMVLPTKWHFGLWERGWPFHQSQLQLQTSHFPQCCYWGSTENPPGNKI